MSEQQPKPFWPQTFTGWVGALTAVCALVGMLYTGGRYGWVLARGVEQFFADIAAIRTSQADLKGYVQDTNNRITKLDTTMRKRLDAHDTKLTELDARAPKKRTRP